MIVFFYELDAQILYFNKGNKENKELLHQVGKKTHAVCCIGKVANFRHLPKNFSALSVSEWKVLIDWG